MAATPSMHLSSLSLDQVRPAFFPLQSICSDCLSEVDLFFMSSDILGASITSWLEFDCRHVALGGGKQLAKFVVSFKYKTFLQK